MPGTDLRQGLAKDNVDRVLTVDSGGNVGNGEGDHIEIMESRLILSTGNQGSMPDVDLRNYTQNDEEVYEVHCLAINVGADRISYERFVYAANDRLGNKVDVLSGGNYTFSISNGILSESGGGNRTFKVRIQRIM